MCVCVCVHVYAPPPLTHTFLSLYLFVLPCQKVPRFDLPSTDFLNKRQNFALYPVSCLGRAHYRCFGPNESTWSRFMTSFYLHPLL